MSRAGYVLTTGSRWRRRPLTRATEPLAALGTGTAPRASPTSPLPLPQQRRSTCRARSNSSTLRPSREVLVLASLQDRQARPLVHGARPVIRHTFSGALIAAIVVGAAGVGGTLYALPYCLAVLSICWLTRRWFV